METFTATYEDGVLVPLTPPDLQEHQSVRLQIVPPRVQISAETARHKANRFLLDQVSYLLGAGQPELIQVPLLAWRVPVLLAYPDRGVVGQAGTVDVHAETGEVLSSPQLIKTIQRNAKNLVTRPSHPPAQ
jgi:predicted DNA-binding antitoxin AbrB/MazE fold protein